MSGILTSDPIAVVESRNRGGIDVDTYKSRLDAVLQIIDNGGIGRSLGGMAYADDEHLAALVKVEQQIAATRAHIAEMRARDAKGLPALYSEDPELVYSLSGDDFSIADMGELIETLRNDHEDSELIGRIYHVGVKQQLSASHYFAGQVDHLIDMARDQAHQQAREHAEDFAQDVPPEALKELDDLIKGWAERYIDVRFWTAKNVEKLQITAEDLE